MNIVRHGLAIGIEHTGHDFCMTLKATGKLTHEDYEVIVPMLESAIEGVRHPQIKLLVDATELAGWELRAAWDDLKLGLRHGNEFTRIAVVGNRDWQKYASKIGGWFIGGETKYFEDTELALDWLNK